MEKRAAARELCAAYYLITGKRYTPAVSVERLCWEDLPKALRACYHQEACNGYNYQRASEEALDILTAPALRQLLLEEGLQHLQRFPGLGAHAAGIGLRACKSCSRGCRSSPTGGRRH